MTEGDDVELACGAIGKPQPQITWLKGEDVVQNGVSYIEDTDNLQTNSNLNLSNIAPERDAGKYTVKAENSAGFVTHDVKVSGTNIAKSFN